MKLFKRFTIIAGYFFLEGSVRKKIEKHQQLAKTLAFFTSNNLIGAKTVYLYLRKYLSTALPVSKSLEILSHHYWFLKDKFSARQRSQLFTSGIVCFAEGNYRLILSGSKRHEREGSLSLYFMDGDVNLAILSFTIGSGTTFGVAAQNVVIISRLQQINAHLNSIKEAKKHFNDVMPTVVLFTALEAICVAFHIDMVIGIYGDHQLSYDQKYHGSYMANYDEFWTHNGGTPGAYGYLMNCPFPQKDLLEIKQTHRNRARKKRARLEGIYNACYATITELLSATVT